MIILGIDPGYATIGYGIINTDGTHFQTISYGAVTTPPNTPFENRLEMIYDGICQLCQKYKPDAAAVEELFFNTNITTAIAVGHSRGVIMLALKKSRVDFYEYTPLQVKQSVVGYGRAEKKQVIDMVTSILNLKAPPKPDDTADALAIAVCHAHSGCSRLAKYLK